MGMIDKFQGDYRWLSNFEEARIVLYGRPYLNNEAAFQAMKTTDRIERIPFETMTGREAKKAGGKVNLRSGWDFMRLNIMYHVNYLKFNEHMRLLDKLIATGDSTLIEGNTWHDNFWGNCECPKCERILGQNYLGRILMQLRDDLQ